MNKSEFIDKVAKNGDFKSKKEAEKAVNAVVDTIKAVLAKKESIELVGFGKFETAIQKAKEGKIPGSNKTYKTKEKRVPKFRAGKALKDAVAGSKK